jgi:phosphohistidine phosphatase
MKTLILIRHAKAEPGSEILPDIDRPLTPLGRRDAAALAEQLKDFELAPTALISSPALRAMQTAEIFSAEFSLAVQSNALLYDAGPEALLKEIRRLKNRCGTAMVVGHNPAIHELLCELTGCRFADVPSGAVAVVRLSVGSWRNAGSGKGALSTSFTPREGPLQREAAGPGLPSRGDRFRMWSLQNRPKLIGVIILTAGLLLLAAILPFMLSSSTNSAGQPQQGSSRP